MNPVTEFIEAACVPLDRSHASGALKGADAILVSHPEVAKGDIYTTAILGDDVSVRRFLVQDPGSAMAKGGPRGWDALTYLCFSRYLRLDSARSDGFVSAATALLDAGASANSGWFEENHMPRPEWEPVLYGAAGVAHHAELTRLLVERGAEVNDEEVVYHSPETWDNGALKVLVDSGRLTRDSLARMLLRKADWHDYEGVKLLLEAGADPNHGTRWGKTAFHNSVMRDNDIEIVELFVDHGADPSLLTEGKSAVSIAARRGRGDILELFERRGIPTQPEGVDRLITACAKNDSAAARAIAESGPHLVGELMDQGGTLLTEFSGVGNTEGVRLLLDLGVPVTALYGQGDGYYGIAKNSTALHVAAWRAEHATLKLLIDRGAPVDARDGEGRTPLTLAVRACVDSYWKERRSPESVDALLRAGASVSGVTYPSGYADVDALLAIHLRP